MYNGNIILLGGSAGSFSILLSILESLPVNFQPAIILCFHRLKTARYGFKETLQSKTHLPIIEPFDKQAIKDKTIYLAPANHHLYIDQQKCFVISTEEAVNHSRPSIDLTFISASNAFKEKIFGILLSGANEDGASGLQKIRENGGLTALQTIDENCAISIMPKAALSLCPLHKKLSIDKIIDEIIKL